MSDIEAQALGIIGLIYDAALERKEWPRLLNTLASAVQGNGALLRQMDMRTRAISFYETAGYDPQYVRAYREHYYQFDPYQNFFQTVAVGELHPADGVLDPRQRRKGTYFNEFELPQDKIFNLGGVLCRDGSADIQIAIQRGSGEGDYSARDYRLLQLLIPHVVRAVRMHRLLETAEYRQNLALAVLDQLRLGVLLYDAAGRLFHCNSMAEDLFAAGVVALREGALALHAGADNAKLRKLMSDARQGLGGDMRCNVGNEREGMHLWVVPLSCERSRGDLDSVSGGTAVFISRLGPLHLPWRRIAHHYGLTPAESRLAAALADGNSLGQAAETLGITYGTARIQLKAVFAKTGARRQSELVAMLLKGMLSICQS